MRRMHGDMRKQNATPTDEFVKASRYLSLPNAEDATGFHVYLTMALPRTLDNHSIPWYTVFGFRSVTRLAVTQR